MSTCTFKELQGVDLCNGNISIASRRYFPVDHDGLLWCQHRTIVQVRPHHTNQFPSMLTISTTSVDNTQSHFNNASFQPPHSAHCAHRSTSCRKDRTDYEVAICLSFDPNSLRVSTGCWVLLATAGFSRDIRGKERSSLSILRPPHSGPWLCKSRCSMRLSLGMLLTFNGCAFVFKR